MKIAKVLIIFAILLTSISASAQYGGEILGPAPANFLPGNDAEGFVQRLTGVPPGSVRLAVADFSGFNTYNIDTTQLGNTACEDVVVYKVSPQNIQDLWPKAYCSGNTLVLITEGTGTYIFYRVGPIQRDTNIPLRLPVSFV